jgi:LysR family transcriptional regulator, flagellar master operon regulator
MMTTRACAGKSIAYPLHRAANMPREEIPFNRGYCRILIGKNDKGAAMQIELIETFLDLVETRSFNRTAERLGITQSSVSGRVQALESATGVRLFNRSRAGTDLSPEGVRFEPHARTLRHEWRETLRQVQAGDHPTIRLGVQNDLAAAHIGELLSGFRKGLPQARFYVEPDYSNQMSMDVLSGNLDFALLYSPKPHPDLHFSSIGTMTYQMVSTDTATRTEVVPDRYIATHFSAAFDVAHRQLVPELIPAPLSLGQSSVVVELLQTMGGTAYVLSDAAERLLATGRFMAVTDAPEISQPIFAAMHVRNRISKTHRRMTRIATRVFSRKSTSSSDADIPEHGPDEPA